MRHGMRISVGLVAATIVAGGCTSPVAESGTRVVMGDSGVPVSAGSSTSVSSATGQRRTMGDASNVRGVRPARTSIETPADVDISSALAIGAEIFRDELTRTTVQEDALLVLDQAVFHPDPLLRANALEALQAAPSRVEGYAVAGLADANAGVRSVAAMTIGQLKLRDSAVKARALLNDPEPRVRASAVYALVMNGYEAERQVLGDLLVHPNPKVRSHSAFVLGELGESSASLMLRDVLRQRLPGNRIEQRIFEVQVNEALAKLGDSGAVAALRAALYPSEVEDLEVSVLAMQALGEIGDRDEVAIGELVRVIEYVTPGSPQGNSPVPNWYRTDPDQQEFVYPPEVRLSAAAALARMGYTDGIYVCRQFIADSDEAVRSQVAYTLGQMSPQRVIGAERDRRHQARREAAGRLKLMLEDPSGLVRIHAAAAILELIGQG
ncbi:MAG: HEAT repeat domain-containing protein [Planctomycetota bacterium]